jgi:hypothetical protein
MLTVRSLMLEPVPPLKFMSGSCGSSPERTVLGPEPVRVSLLASPGLERETGLGITKLPGPTLTESGPGLSAAASTAAWIEVLVPVKFWSQLASAGSSAQ